mmetsp:Transcript_39351/g.101809  ORF Transcript_39351/g.101809 Transcript_39351/m.101809 type:complete len:282 (-) Transcript_39351:229-1074(-)
MHCCSVSDWLAVRSEGVLPRRGDRAFLFSGVAVCSDNDLLGERGERADGSDLRGDLGDSSTLREEMGSCCRELWWARCWPCSASAASFCGPSQHAGLCRGNSTGRAKAGMLCRAALPAHRGVDGAGSGSTSAASASAASAYSCAPTSTLCSTLCLVYCCATVSTVSCIILLIPPNISCALPAGFRSVPGVLPRCAVWSSAASDAVVSRLREGVACCRLQHGDCLALAEARSEGVECDRAEAIGALLVCGVASAPAAGGAVLLGGETDSACGSACGHAQREA